MERRGSFVNTRCSLPANWHTSVTYGAVTSDAPTTLTHKHIKGVPWYRSSLVVGEVTLHFPAIALEASDLRLGDAFEDVENVGVWSVEEVLFRKE